MPDLTLVMSVSAGGPRNLVKVSPVTVLFSMRERDFRPCPIGITRQVRTEQREFQEKAAIPA